ncbi:hypothetical protein [Bdellovibrio sp. NC01]|uniref:hypothetical protein n=1 Tax=Bdellovibrio sp. NC01 TaxID=2220073 RepID=UPI001158E690|nr:hypothetical protein [Bdellovibrio sp. NC01]QDK38726.1 hypothetical protein DOE51_14590 [Bdellovibrio sp. NC01]
MKHTSRSEHSKFRTHSENICHLISEEGLSFRPYAREALTYFSLLDEALQRAIVVDLMNYYQICLDMRATGQTLKSTRVFTEKALDRLDLHIDPKELERIEDQHIIEIYDVDQRQIFRSFRFFEVSSYTLEDLLCRRWYHIFLRPPEHEAAFQAKVNEFFTASEKKTMELGLPECPVSESETLERLKIFAQVHRFVPLFDQNKQFKAVMLVITARPEK